MVAALASRAIIKLPYRHKPSSTRVSAANFVLSEFTPSVRLHGLCQQQALADLSHLNICDRASSHSKLKSRNTKLLFRLGRHPVLGFSFRLPFGAFISTFVANFVGLFNLHASTLNNSRPKDLIS